MERKRAEEEARRRAEDLKRDAEREEARRRAEADTQLKVRYYEVIRLPNCYAASSHAAPQLPVAPAAVLLTGMRRISLHGWAQDGSAWFVLHGRHKWTKAQIPLAQKEL